MLRRGRVGRGVWRVEEGVHAIGFAGGADGAEPGLGVGHVGGGVGGLEGGEEVEGEEAGLVGWVDDLGVFDAVPVVEALAG